MSDGRCWSAWASGRVLASSPAHRGVTRALQPGSSAAVDTLDRCRPRHDGTDPDTSADDSNVAMHDTGSQSRGAECRRVVDVLCSVYIADTGPGVATVSDIGTVPLWCGGWSCRGR
eukprot:TRINITY_DN13620_c0_g1_i1.p4 TRINITY_DN13620_c0_g1~~TRINITY_DN13620_c0_g1_i1.p4  ORF type:complete len:116 (-),score=7.18 TRINITY_DN13620_c0_g1_i1:463-810(-)